MLSGGPHIFYLDGPGDLIGAYRHWRAGRPDPTQTDSTFSGQLFEVAERLGASLHAIAWPGDGERLQDGRFLLEHRPRPFPHARGATFHLVQALWAAELVAVALRSRADVAVLADGPHPFLFAPLRAAGMKLVPVMHTTLWPAGHRPRDAKARAIAGAQGWLFRRADATLVVSPECERQVREVAGTMRGPIAHFRPSYGAVLAEPRRGTPVRPFRVLFAGRIERNKGVLELVDLAVQLEAEHPGGFHFTLCGGGPAEAELAARVAARGAGGVVALRGRLRREDMVKEYAACDAVLVPTPIACEGLNRVALEAALSGRPVVLSDTTPAREILGAAALTVRAGDLEGYGRALRRLADDPALYRASCEAAVQAGRSLLDPALSFGEALARTLGEILPG
jgi:glycosyltransferase involved in cell wall biosynthesis